jgi:hypothetical protein
VFATKSSGFIRNTCSYLTFLKQSCSPKANHLCDRVLSVSVRNFSLYKLSFLCIQSNFDSKNSLGTTDAYSNIPKLFVIFLCVCVCVFKDVDLKIYFTISCSKHLSHPQVFIDSE